MASLEGDVSRAQHAERLLSDALLAQAFDGLEADYLKAWRETGARDTDARERLWQAIQIVGKVRTHLKSAVSDGKLARRELDDIARNGERRKIFGVV